jgi:hypothetical protein
MTSLTNSNECIIIKDNEEPQDFMSKLGKLMNDPNFKQFFVEYFKDWTDVKTSIMLMKTYAFIDDEYYKNTGVKMAPEEVINILKKMIQDKECRQFLVEEMSEFIKDTRKGKFLEYYTHAQLN